MIGIIIFTFVSLIFSIILVNLESKFNNKESKTLSYLPGYNCGACGYSGCADLASKIDKNPELYKKCKLLRGENLEKMQSYLKEKYGEDI